MSGLALREGSFEAAVGDDPEEGGGERRVGAKRAMRE